jgi:two-component system CheB/CheR fusion protein
VTSPGGRLDVRGVALAPPGALRHAHNFLSTRIAHACGMLGLRAIKESGGVTFVQEPGTAAFDGMPRSAVDADVADVVAPVDELAGLVLEQVSRPATAAAERLAEAVSDERRADSADRDDLTRIVELLRVATGHDVSQYKQGTIMRRIERRMGLHQLARLSDYLRYLHEHPAELGRLHRELMIGVTNSIPNFRHRKKRITDPPRTGSSSPRVQP